MRLKLLGELLQQLATADLATCQIVGAVEECALLGVDQAGAIARWCDLHRGQRDRHALASSYHGVGQHDPPVGHDIEVDCVVAHWRATLEAEACGFTAANSKVD